MSEQEIIIRKSAELKLMIGLALSLEECETFIKDVLEAQEQVNVTLGNVSNNEVTVCELTEWDGGDETNLCDCGKGEGKCKRQTDC